MNKKNCNHVIKVRNNYSHIVQVIYEQNEVETNFLNTYTPPQKREKSRYNNSYISEMSVCNNKRNNTCEEYIKKKQICNKLNFRIKYVNTV